MDPGGWAQPGARYLGPPGMGLSDQGAMWQKSQGRGEGWYSAVMCLRGAELHRRGRVEVRKQQSGRKRDQPYLQHTGWEKPAASKWEGHCGGRGTKPKGPLRSTPSTNIAGWRRRRPPLIDQLSFCAESRERPKFPGLFPLPGASALVLLASRAITDSASGSDRGGFMSQPCLLKSLSSLRFSHQ